MLESPSFGTESFLSAQAVALPRCIFGIHRSFWIGIGLIRGTTFWPHWVFWGVEDPRDLIVVWVVWIIVQIHGVVDLVLIVGGVLVVGVHSRRDGQPARVGGFARL